MTITDIRNGDSKPRICMPTRRRICKQVFHCALYEAEDVLAATSDVDLICLEPGAGFESRNKWLSRAAFHDVSERLALVNPGIKPVQLTQGYDLFVAVCQSYEDLLYINAIKGWENRCRTSVCWIDEIWAGSIHKYRHWMSALRRFEYVFVGLKGSVEPLSKAIGTSCQWLPGAVDTLRFVPHFRNTPRTIDVLSAGRRLEGIHQSLRSMASKNELFYLHDTFSAARAVTFDYQEHRELFARILQRSRYFIVAPAKMDAPGETKGQIDIGYRYFEGASAGAVMIGQRADSEWFREMFDWQDAVIEIKKDGSDVRDVIRSLETQPQRLFQISQRNIAEALLRCDWIHRWLRIFEVAGLKPSAGMMLRMQHLQRLSESTPPIACVE